MAYPPQGTEARAGGGASLRRPTASATVSTREGPSVLSPSKGGRKEREIGAKRQRRVEKGTGNDRRGRGGVGRDLRSKPLAKVQPIRR